MEFLRFRHFSTLSAILFVILYLVKFSISYAAPRVDPPVLNSGHVVYASRYDEFSAFDVNKKELLWVLPLPSPSLNYWNGAGEYIGVWCKGTVYRVIDGRVGRLVETELILSDGRVVGVCGASDPLVMQKTSNAVAELARRDLAGNLLWAMPLFSYSNVCYHVRSFADIAVVRTSERQGGASLLLSRTGDGKISNLFIVDLQNGNKLAETNVYLDAFMESVRNSSKGDLVLCDVGSQIVAYSRARKKIVLDVSGRSAATLNDNTIAVAKGADLLIYDVANAELRIRHKISVSAELDWINAFDGVVYDAQISVDVESGKVSSRRPIFQPGEGTVSGESVTVDGKKYVCLRKSLSSDAINRLFCIDLRTQMATQVVPHEANGSAIISE